MDPKMKQYIDAHAHLADPRFEADLDQKLAHARSLGIHRWIQAGVDPEDWQRQLRLKQKYGDSIVLGFGLHPWWVADQSDRGVLESALQRLESILPQAASLGELGLDYARERSKVHQGWMFEAQLKLAQKMDKPLVLHVVKAHPDALAALKKVGVPQAGGIVHSFSGSREVARQYLDFGLTISVGTAVTKGGFETLKKAVAFIPENRLVVETDSPDQPPAGTEGTINEPANLLRVAQAVGALRKQGAEAVLEKSAENLIRIFRLGVVA